jgi:two-component system, response regulator PdtaR
VKVLIVDDEALVRRSLERACSSRGHIVEQAEDGQKGIELWQSWHPDLVFLDVLMPKLSGVEVLKRLNGQHTAKVVMMSAYTGAESLDKSGVDLFLAKPFQDIFSFVHQAEELCLEHHPRR